MGRRERLLKTMVTDPQPAPIGIIGMVGRYQVKVTRGDGREEWYTTPNVVVQTGMTMLARHISSYGLGANSLMAYIAIGTSTTVASVNQATTLGEVKRLAFAASSVTTNNSWSAVTTFGGGTDSIVGVVVAEAGVWNAAGSGAGVMFNRGVLGSTFTLQSSDIALVQVIVSVGSL